jgi:hypothetical protein
MFVSIYIYIHIYSHPTLFIVKNIYPNTNPSLHAHTLFHRYKYINVYIFNLKVVARGIKDLLVCVEMFGASLAYILVFPLSDYTSSSSSSSLLLPSSSNGLTSSSSSSSSTSSPYHGMMPSPSPLLSPTTINSMAISEVVLKDRANSVEFNPFNSPSLVSNANRQEGNRTRDVKLISNENRPVESGSPRIIDMDTCLSSETLETTRHENDPLRPSSGLTSSSSSASSSPMPPNSTASSSSFCDTFGMKWLCCHQSDALASTCGSSSSSNSIIIKLGGSSHQSKILKGKDKGKHSSFFTNNASTTLPKHSFKDALMICLVPNELVSDVNKLSKTFYIKAMKFISCGKIDKSNGMKPSSQWGERPKD